MTLFAWSVIVAFVAFLLVSIVVLAVAGIEHLERKLRWARYEVDAEKQRRSDAARRAKSAEARADLYSKACDVFNVDLQRYAYKWADRFAHVVARGLYATQLRAANAVKDELCQAIQAVPRSCANRAVHDLRMPCLECNSCWKYEFKIQPLLELHHEAEKKVHDIEDSEALAYNEMLPIYDARWHHAARRA